MPLVTANQFQLQPNTAQAISSGLQLGGQFKQAFQRPQINQLRQQAIGGDQQALQQLAGIAPEQAAQVQQFGANQQQAVQAQQKQEAFKLKQRATSVAEGALQAQNLPDDRSKLNFLKKRRDDLIAQGIDTQDTDQAIQLFESGQGQQANAMLDSAVNSGRQLGILKELSTKPQEIAIRQQEANLRRDEIKERNIERSLKRETNTIKKEELQIKLDETKRKNVQAKKDRDFNANNAVTTTSNTIDTIDRMLASGGLESAAGFQANFPTIAGSEASGFEAMLDTLQSQAFLGEIEKMKGLGALSESEGKKLAQSIGSLTINQPDELLRSELTRIKGAMELARDKLKAKFGINTGALSQSETDELAQLRAELGQ